MGSKLQIFLDLSPITLKKRREFKLLTTVLVSHKIRYRWGFPFKLIVYIGVRFETISTVQVAKDLCSKFKRGCRDW